MKSWQPASPHPSGGEGGVYKPKHGADSQQNHGFHYWGNLCRLTCLRVSTGFKLVEEKYERNYALAYRYVY